MSEGTATPSGCNADGFRWLVSLFAVAVLCLLAAWLVFSDSLQCGFLNWDDPMHVLENQGIKRLDGETLRYAFSDPGVANWIPLTVLSFALDYSLWGLNPYGYRLTSVCLHLLNVVLVMMLMFRMTRLAGNVDSGLGERALFSLVVAMYFAVHPFHVESVAWISERKDLLFSIFYLLSMLAHTHYARTFGRSKVVWWGASFALFCMSLMSKPMAVTLPVALLILDFYPLRRMEEKGISRRFGLILEKLPHVAAALIVSGITLWMQAISEAAKTFDIVPPLQRILVAVWAYGFYLFKSFVPLGLSPFYPHPALSSANLSPMSIGLSAFCIAGLSFLSFRARKRIPLFFTAWLFFVVTLLPVIGLVHVGGQAAADRYMYLPILAPLTCLGGLLVWIYQKTNLKAIRILTYAIVVIFGVFLGVSAHAQTFWWCDSLSLWTRVIDQFPGQEALPYFNRGRAFDDLGRYNDAVADYSRALDIKPGHASARVNRGINYSIAGRHDLALTDFSTVIRTAPSNAAAYSNRGATFQLLGQYEAAMRDYSEALRLEPKDARTMYNLALLYLDSGRNDAARGMLLDAERLGLGEARDLLEKIGRN